VILVDDARKPSLKIASLPSGVTYDSKGFLIASLEEDGDKLEED